MELLLYAVIFSMILIASNATNKLVPSLPLPLGPNSIARTMAAVRGAHAFWVSAFLMEKDPAATVTPPKNVKRLPKAVSVEDIQRLLAVPDRETATGLRNRAILEFLYATGRARERNAQRRYRRRAFRENPHR